MDQPVSSAPDPAPDDDDDRAGGVGRLAAILRGRGLPGYVFWFLLAAGLIIAASLIAVRCDEGDDLPDRLRAGVDTSDTTSDGTADGTADETDGAPEATPAPAVEQEESEAAPAEPGEVVVDIDDTTDPATITVSGTVADQDTADTILAALADTYPGATIDDQLVIDDTVTDDGATLRLRGRTRDTTADTLRTTLQDRLTDTGVTLDDTDLDATAAQAGEVVVDIDDTTDPATITVSGTVADQDTADTILAALADTYPGATIDDQLVIDDTVTDDGATLRLRGRTRDTTADTLRTTLQDRLTDTGITLDDTDLDATAAQASNVTIELGAGAVTLTGAVADDATRTLLFDPLAALFGDRVVDQLTVDPAVATDGGTIALVGQTEEATAAAIRDGLAPLVDAGYGLDEDGFEVRESTEVVDDLNEFFALNPVQFATGSDTILAESRPVLDEVADILLSNPGLRLVVEGHTDDVGEPASNQALSERRATSVVAYLVAAGVADDRLAPVGKGQTEPVADNATAEGRAQNRRIEFQIAAS